MLLNYNKVNGNRTPFVGETPIYKQEGCNNMDIKELRKEIIGYNTFVCTPYGKRLITYADYIGSGKTITFIEKHLIELQKVYANTHSEESFTGKTMTDLFHISEMKIKACLNASDTDCVIPIGTGSTGAIQKFACILGVYYSPVLKNKIAEKFHERPSKKCGFDCTGEFVDEICVESPVVFISQYEHHSNELIWRESLADVVVINLTEEGYFDLEDLEQKVSQEKYINRQKIGAFSAASNVTGIMSPVYDIACIMHKYNGIACFDFAASGPYVDIDMNRDEHSYFDAIFLSPHKFLGGPGSTGLLIFKKNLYDGRLCPTVPGGGTISYVFSEGYSFIDSVEMRELAGTPGILQMIKAALAFELKEEISIKTIDKIEKRHIKLAFDRLREDPNVELLGPLDGNKRISIMPFNIKYKNKYLHHKLVSTLLNDLFGIQARPGCDCAGPYGHTLLNITNDIAERHRSLVLKGYFSLKPGWTRVNFHYMASEDEVKYICDAIQFLSKYGYLFVGEYIMNTASGGWTHKNHKKNNPLVEGFGIDFSMKMKESDVFRDKRVNRTKKFKKYLEEANQIVNKLKVNYREQMIRFGDEDMDELCCYPISQINGSLPGLDTYILPRHSP